MTPRDLAAFIARHDISKDDWAQICGVSLKSFYSWINGQHPVPRSVAIVLSAYDAGLIDLDWLVSFVERDIKEKELIF